MCVRCSWASQPSSCVSVSPKSLTVLPPSVAVGLSSWSLSAQTSFNPLCSLTWSSEQPEAAEVIVTPDLQWGCWGMRRVSSAPFTEVTTRLGRWTQNRDYRSEWEMTRESSLSVALPKASLAPLEPSVVEGDGEKWQEPLSSRQFGSKTLERCRALKTHSTRAAGEEVPGCWGSPRCATPSHSSSEWGPNRDHSSIPRRYWQTRPLSSSFVLCTIIWQSLSAEVTLPTVWYAYWLPGGADTLSPIPIEEAGGLEWAQKPRGNHFPISTWFHSFLTHPRVGSHHSHIHVFQNKWYSFLKMGIFCNTSR